jgi:hypothetical protein
MQLTIVAIKDHPTHFAGLPRPTLHLNVLGEEGRGSKKAVASTLVHEVIHAVHRHDDAVAYKLRNTTASLAPGFPNQEEELTITGAIQGSGLRAAIDCENWARRCMGLPERLDYNSKSHPSDMAGGGQAFAITWRYNHDGRPGHAGRTVDVCRQTSPSGFAAWADAAVTPGAFAEGGAFDQQVGLLSIDLIGLSLNSSAVVLHIRSLFGAGS